MLYEKEVINMPSKYKSIKPFFWSLRAKIDINGDLSYFDEKASIFYKIKID
jgi:hypothetical protein